MPLNDDIIRRWLNEAAADTAPRLDRAQEHVAGMDADMDAESQAEVQRQRDRLRLVQGLLSTLDLKAAPKELDALVEQGQAELSSSGLSELEFEDWLAGAGPEPVIEPRKAPEFLDRIVEQRLAAMQDTPHPDAAAFQTNTPLGRPSPWTGPRRILAGATLALALLAAPAFLGGVFDSAHDAQPAPLRLVNYDSLEGLQKAFPNQSQVANGMGMLGAFGTSSSSGQDLGGPR